MKIVSGTLDSPDRTLLVGIEGVGKSTYGSRTLEPVFIETEKGSDELQTQRARLDETDPFPFHGQERPPEAYEEVCYILDAIPAAFPQAKTIVIDTADALHLMIEAYLIDRDNQGKQEADKKTSIEDFGYGKGHVMAAEEWRRFLARVERVQAKMRADVLFLVHSTTKKYNPPDSEPYDRYDLKIPERSAAVLREWCKNMFLAQHDVSVKKGDPKKMEKNKAYTGNGCVLRTRESAAYRAKNRFGLPPTIPFDADTYDVIQAARRATLAADAELDKLLVGHPDPAKVKKWFSAQADKSAALDALRKKAEASKTAAKETQQ